MTNVDMRWLIEKEIPFNRILQWKVTQTDSDGREWIVSDWTDVPVVTEGGR